MAPPLPPPAPEPLGPLSLSPCHSTPCISDGRAVAVKWIVSETMIRVEYWVKTSQHFLNNVLVKTLPQHSYARMISLDQGWNKRGLVIPVTDSPKLISPAPGSSQLAVVAAIIFRLHLDIPICLIPCLRSCIQEKSILLPVMLHLETKHLISCPKLFLHLKTLKKSLISDSSENSLWLVCCWELFMVPKLPSHQLPVSVSSILFLSAFLSLFVFVSSGWTCGEIILLEITSWNIVAGHKQGVGLVRKAKSQNDIKDRRMLCWLLGCNLGIFYISNTAIP